MEEMRVDKEIPGMAIASLVCGILAIILPFVDIVLGVIAIVFGVKARRMTKEKGERYAGEAMALAGLICGIIGIGTAFLWFFWFFFVIIGLLGGVTENLFNYWHYF